MHDALAIARHMDTPDRLAAAWVLVSRAQQWAAACTGTADLLAAMEVVTWARQHHAGVCAE